MQTFELPPYAPTLIESTRAIGYSLEAAVADIIDNSIAADANHVDLFFFPVDGEYIAILDNGSGMNANELNSAMQYGSKSPNEVRKSNDLGRFGLGLKTASLSQCRKLTVVTKQGQNKNALRNTVKGSDDAKSIRLISANALFQMVKIVSASSSDTTRKQVISMLQPRDYFVLDNLVELVFPQTDADIPEIDDNDDDESLNSSNTEQYSFSSKTVGNTKYPPLPDPNMKAGNFIKTAMTNLANSGFEFTDEQIVELCKEESMHTVVGLSRHLPFFKHFDPEDSKGHLIDGRPRFYSKPLTFGKHTVYLNSQLYDGDKEPFISWYEALTN